MSAFTGLLLALASAAPGLAQEKGVSDLAPPVRLTAGGKPILAEGGMAAPFMGDIDGDGKPDLLVGTMGQGRLWIYRNIGTRTRPEFAEGEVFKAGGTEACVPSG